MPPLFTVYTPTYQRAQFLERAYNSLLRQEDRDFEWIVIDDGSTDGTDRLLSRWESEGDLDLRWKWQPNVGKARATNRAVELARGELFIVLDSDDWLADHALKRMRERWFAIPEDERGRHKGLVGLFADATGKVVGSSFPYDGMVTDTVTLKHVHKVTGDNFGFIRTEVMRQFPYPEVDGFQPLTLVWNRMARHYTQICINEVLAYKEYQRTGLSATGRPLRMRTPSVWRLRYEELLEHEALPLGSRIKTGANYVRFALHEGLNATEILRRPDAGTWLLGAPIGVAAWLDDRRRGYGSTP